MDLLVTYDVNTTTPEGRRRLRKIAQGCQNYGQRVQMSVFECRVDPGQFEALEVALLKILNPLEDSLRIYVLRSGRDKVLRAYGIDRYRDFDDPLVL